MAPDELKKWNRLNLQRRSLQTPVQFQLSREGRVQGTTKNKTGEPQCSPVLPQPFFQSVTAAPLVAATANRLELERVTKCYGLEPDLGAAVVVFAGEQAALRHIFLRRWIVRVGNVEA